MGDPVAIVLNTDPPSVLMELGTLGADGRPIVHSSSGAYVVPALST